jgi:monovalent cation/proton antiporter MnhG/PhaG subunit
MKTTDLLVDVFLVAGVICQLICCLGVLVMPTAFDRLHFTGAGMIFGPLLVGSAVLVRQTTSGAGIETAVTMVLIFVTGPVLVLATARAIRRSQRGHIRPTADERRAAT